MTGTLIFPLTLGLISIASLLRRGGEKGGPGITFWAKTESERVQVTSGSPGRAFGSDGNSPEPILG